MSLIGFKYDFKNIRRGDTYKGAELRVNNITQGIPIDLTGVSIRMQMKRLHNDRGQVFKELSTANGLMTITDPTDGKFTINAFNMNIPAGQYQYDIEFTFTGNIVQTYIFGTWVVVEDVTD